MTTIAKKLNLDEIFGLARPITVIWKGVEYDLPRPEAFSPKSWAGFTSLQGKVATLQVMGEHITDEQSQELDDITTECIKFLSPKLAEKKLPFFMRVQVIAFYGEQVAPPEDEPKNVPGSSTGETLSAGSASGTD